MSEYQALYRKWRPMRFEDIAGQSHVSNTLKTAIASGRTSHAYLFCGTRGTGKTSTAKIFSRAVNCQNPIDGEPCNECPSCKGILDGSILDVYEMDAASNRGVENIREIRDEVIYTPVGCKYKVYIIDEVHMLTAEAFNALLKTLEEPPAHAIFILATTEPHKIPSTVLSRCQRFDFRRISVDDIATRITKITNAENIDITPDAAEMIAELGDGSMRDAISLLDRCSAFGSEKLTSERVSDILGTVGSAKLFDIANAISENNSALALKLSGEILREGKEAQNLIENLIDHFRALLICKASDKPSELLEKTESASEKYSAQAEKYSVERLLYSIKTLGEYVAQSKWLSKPATAVEMAMVKLCTPSYSTDTDALLARIEKLETAIANLSSGITPVSVKTEPEKETDDIDLSPPWDTDEPEKKVETPTVAQQSKNSESWEFWSEALSEIKKESKMLYAFLYNGVSVKNGDSIDVEVEGKVAYDRIATPDGIAYLSKLFSRVAGETLNVRVFIKGDRPNNTENDTKGFSINDLADKKDMFDGKIDIV